MNQEDATPPSQEEVLAQVQRFIDRIDPARPRLVIRYVDETRIQPHGAQGFQVAPVSWVILTAMMTDGSPAQERFEGITVSTLRHVLARSPLEIIYRSDNIVR